MLIFSPSVTSPPLICKYVFKSYHLSVNFCKNVYEFNKTRYKKQKQEKSTRKIYIKVFFLILFIIVLLKSY